MLRLAIVGAGHWGPNLINNFHRVGGRDADDGRSEVLWVIDADEARLAVVRERFPDLNCSSDFAQALADARVDGVVIATPTSTHYQIARDALESGRHVLVEKPIASTSEQAESLCQIAADRGLVLMVGHVFVYNVAAQRAKQYLTSGELGRVYYIAMERTNLGPIRVDVNAAWDLAAHDIALANYWLDAHPVSASASGGSWINPGIEDAVFATLRYPNDVLVHVHASWLHPRKGREIAIVGDQKMLTFDDTDLKEPLHLYDKRVAEERSHPVFVDSIETFRMAVREGSVVAPKLSMKSPLEIECDHFLDCVLTGQACLSGGSEGLAAVQVLEAISASLGDGSREIAVAGR